MASIETQKRGLLGFIELQRENIITDSARFEQSDSMVEKLQLLLSIKTAVNQMFDAQQVLDRWEGR